MSLRNALKLLLKQNQNYLLIGFQQVKKHAHHSLTRHNGGIIFL